MKVFMRSHIKLEMTGEEVERRPRREMEDDLVTNGNASAFRRRAYAPLMSFSMVSRKMPKSAQRKTTFLHPEEEAFHYRFLFRQSISSEAWQIFEKLAIATLFLWLSSRRFSLFLAWVLPFFSPPARHDDINRKKSFKCFMLSIKPALRLA